MKTAYMSITVFFLFIFFILPKIQAQEIQSQQYQLQDEVIEVDQPGKTLPVQESILTLNKKETILFEQNGYLSYESKNDLFTFTVSKAILLFDTTSAKGPLMTNTDLHVSSALTEGYQVNLIEEANLSNFDGSILKNTVCDNFCSRFTAGMWLDNSKIGSGYSLSGDSPADFKSSYFRQFPIEKNNDKSINIMYESNKHLGNENILVKINPENKTIYTALLKIIALPGY